MKSDQFELGMISQNERKQYNRKPFGDSNFGFCPYNALNNVLLILEWYQKFLMSLDMFIA